MASGTGASPRSTATPDADATPSTTALPTTNGDTIIIALRTSATIIDRPIHKSN
jgi:hypothetical protein